MTGRTKSGYLDGVLMLFLAALTVWLGLDLRSTKIELRETRKAARELNDSALVWRMQSKVAHRLLYTIPLPRSFQAVDVGSGQSREIVLTSRMVFYVVSPSCSACEENFPAMSEIESEFPGSVHVLTSASPTEARAAYGSHLQEFPFFSVPSRTLYQMVSSAVTPITLATSGRSRTKYWYGQITPRVENEIRGLSGRDDQKVPKSLR